MREYRINSVVPLEHRQVFRKINPSQLTRHDFLSGQYMEWILWIQSPTSKSYFPTWVIAYVPLSKMRVTFWNNEWKAILSLVRWMQKNQHVLCGNCVQYKCVAVWKYWKIIPVTRYVLCLDLHTFNARLRVILSIYTPEFVILFIWIWPIVTLCVAENRNIIPCHDGLFRRCHCECWKYNYSDTLQNQRPWDSSMVIHFS